MVHSGCELWLKDDGMICPDYGGNKPRKLAHLLEDAERRQAKRLITVGAIGSHHVLATGILGRRLGLPTTAIALPRPYSQSAEQTTKATIAAGVELIPLVHAADLGRLAMRLGRRGDYWIPAGGSNGLGALGFVDAAGELKQQIAEEQLPLPDLVIVALGSGGTAAGLLAGFQRHALASHVLGVSVLKFPFGHAWVCSLARRALKCCKYPMPTDFSSQLTIDTHWIGRGYGCPTAAGELAIEEAAQLGLRLEPTYTGKAFACALAWLRRSRDQSNVSMRAMDSHRQQIHSSESRRCKRILFWSTFSTVSPVAPDDGAVSLPPAIARLFR